MLEAEDVESILGRGHGDGGWRRGGLGKGIGVGRTYMLLGLSTYAGVYGLVMIRSCQSVGA